jgi:hypothetical protein
VERSAERQLGSTVGGTLTVSFLVDTLPISTSNVGVVRAIWQRFHPDIRRNPDLRSARKALYRWTIARHSENRGFASKNGVSRISP